MKRFEPSTLYSLNDKTKLSIVTEYEQPWTSWVLGTVVRQIDKLTYKMWGIKHVLAWTSYAVEKNHKRRCDGECTVAYRRLPTDPPGQIPPDDDEHRVLVCGHMPLYARWDVWVYDVQARNREPLRVFHDKSGHRPA